MSSSRAQKGSQVLKVVKDAIKECIEALKKLRKRVLDGLTPAYV